MHVCFWDVKPSVGLSPPVLASARKGPTRGSRFELWIATIRTMQSKAAQWRRASGHTGRGKRERALSCSCSNAGPCAGSTGTNDFCTLLSEGWAKRGPIQRRTEMANGTQRQQSFFCHPGKVPSSDSRQNMLPLGLALVRPWPLGCTRAGKRLCGRSDFVPCRERA